MEYVVPDDPRTSMPALSDDDLQWALGKDEHYWGFRLWKRLQNEDKRRQALRKSRRQ